MGPSRSIVSQLSHTVTMNTYHHSSKSMTTLTRLREQQETYNVTPYHSEEEEDLSTVDNKSDDKKSTITDSTTPSNQQEPRNELQQSEPQNEPDLFTPLSYDEASEDQLAEFFTNIDIDVSFGGCDSIINNMADLSEDTSRHTKRRRLSNSGDSFSTSFSDEIYDYDEARKAAQIE